MMKDYEVIIIAQQTNNDEKFNDMTFENEVPSRTRRTSIQKTICKSKITYFFALLPKF
jgi:hypothetical protein